jgi:hypothetical protein
MPMPKYHVQRQLFFDTAETAKVKPAQARAAVSLAMAVGAINASMSTILPQTIHVNTLDHPVSKQVYLLPNLHAFS